MALDAIVRNRLFVITHNEFKAGVRTRLDAILTGFPAGAVNEERARASGIPVANPLYSQILESEAVPP